MPSAVEVDGLSDHGRPQYKGALATGRHDAFERRVPVVRCNRKAPDVSRGEAKYLCTYERHR